MKAAKETEEFENIYRTYYRDVFAFMYRTCGQDHDLAEELTQETFFEAFRCFYRYNATCTIYTWLCAIGKNIWFHYLRKHKNTALDLEAFGETLCDDEDCSPEAYAERSEKSDMIRKALDTLRPRYREIIWLRGVSDLPFSQIAQIMDITENSAKVLYFRAKNQIKEKLSNEGLI